jgi:hypothetical protein
VLRVAPQPRRSCDLCTTSMAVIEAAAIIGARLFEKR